MAVIYGAGDAEINVQGGAKQAKVRAPNYRNNLIFNSKDEINSSALFCSFILALR